MWIIRVNLIDYVKKKVLFINKNAFTSTGFSQNLKHNWKYSVCFTLPDFEYTEPSDKYIFHLHFPIPNYINYYIIFEISLMWRILNERLFQPYDNIALLLHFKICNSIAQTFWTHPIYLNFRQEWKDGRASKV